MNGTLRFVVIAFFLALYYHWLCDASWSDGEENDSEESHEDLISKLSQSLHRKSGDQVVKGDHDQMQPDLEDNLHTRKYLLLNAAIAAASNVH